MREVLFGTGLMCATVSLAAMWWTFTNRRSIAVTKRSRLIGLALTAALVGVAGGILKPFGASGLARIGANGGGADAALTVFSIITSIVIGYALTVITAFDSKRQLLDERLLSLDQQAKALVARDTEQSAALGTVTVSLRFQEARTTAFLELTSRLADLDADDVEEDRKKAMDLRMMRATVGRSDPAGLLFDLQQIEALLRNRGDDIQRQFTGVFVEFLDASVDMYKHRGGKEPSGTVEAFAKLVADIKRDLRDLRGQATDD